VELRNRSATTTHADKAAIQRSQASLAQLSRDGGEWRKRATAAGVGFRDQRDGNDAGFSAIRMLEQRELGADALGQLQVPWAIRMTYLGFVLGAMGTDYLPSADRTRSSNFRLQVEWRIVTRRSVPSPVISTVQASGASIALLEAYRLG
jgi:hypothetical protein